MSHMSHRSHKSLGLACITIEGADATKFLQSQLTSDVLAIALNQCQLSAYCNQKGYVEALFWLKRTDNGFAALIAEDLVANTLTLFKKYGAFSKVTFQVHMLNVDRFELYQQTSPLLWNDTLNLALPVSPLMHTQVSSNAKWRAYWLNLKIPTLTAATAGLFRPHELNLPECNAVSFTKGCYPGQEIVARMHYLGKSKTHLQYLQLHTCENPPKPGENLTLTNTVCATVVDCLKRDDHGYTLSVVMPDNFYAQLPFTCQYGELSPVIHE